MDSYMWSLGQVNLPWVAGAIWARHRGEKSLDMKGEQLS